MKTEYHKNSLLVIPELNGTTQRFCFGTLLSYMNASKNWALDKNNKGFFLPVPLKPNKPNRYSNDLENFCSLIENQIKLSEQKFSNKNLENFINVLEAFLKEEPSMRIHKIIAFYNKISELIANNSRLSKRDLLLLLAIEKPFHDIDIQTIESYVFDALSIKNISKNVIMSEDDITCVFTKTRYELMFSFLTIIPEKHFEKIYMIDEGKIKLDILKDAARLAQSEMIQNESLVLNEINKIFAENSTVYTRALSATFKI